MGLQNTWTVFGRKMSKEVQALDFFVHPRYLEGHTLDYDFGLVKLDVPVGKTAGWASVRAYEESQLSKLKVNITGYPAIKNPMSAISYGLLRTGSYNMYTMEGPIKAITVNRIFYLIDTSGGQSGSGVWVTNPEGIIECVGIHTTGDKILGNGAIRINEENFEVILEWLTKFGQV